MWYNKGRALQSGKAVFFSLPKGGDRYDDIRSYSITHAYRYDHRRNRKEEITAPVSNKAVIYINIPF